MASSDILVLGAGMVGVSAALALQERGHAVTLVDRNANCRETSYGNAGLIQREALRPYAFPRGWRAMLRAALGRGNDVHYQWTGLLRAAPHLLRYRANSSPEAYAPIARAFAALIAHCISEHAVWVEQSGAHDLIRKTGWLQAFRTRALLDEESAEAQAIAREGGLACEVLDAAALARVQTGLQHNPFAGAIHWQDPWAVSDPGELVDRYAALFVRKGGRLLTGDARTLRQHGKGWSVATAQGQVDAAQAVIALGPWSDAAVRTLGYKLPLFVKRGYHRHYRTETPLALPMLDVEQGFLLAPMKRGLRITTGAEFAALDAPATPVQLDRAERAARRMIALGERVEAQPWLGARPCTADMKPVIGAAPKHKGLWFNFGHAHQGFTLGPASGRLLAELVSGKTPYLNPAPYAPARF